MQRIIDVFLNMTLKTKIECTDGFVSFLNRETS